MSPIDFDTVHYDPDADVLYLSIGGPERAVDFEESPEGHALRYDEDGDLVGITIVGHACSLTNTARSDEPSIWTLLATSRTTIHCSSTGLTALDAAAPLSPDRRRRPMRRCSA